MPEVAAPQTTVSPTTVCYDTTGSCYDMSAVNLPMFLADARDYCDQAGGHILALETETEHKTILKLIVSNPGKYIAQTGGVGGRRGRREEFMGGEGEAKGRDIKNDNEIE